MRREASAWWRLREVDDYGAHLNERAGSQLDALPLNSRKWLDLAVEITQELDPSAKRLVVLRDPPEVATWYGPFGQPVVS